MNEKVAADSVLEIADLREEVATLEGDVLTAWRVRNAALKVAATFVHPGPDGQDYIERERLVREWVDQGHEEVAEHDRQLAVAITRMSAAEAVCAVVERHENPPSDVADALASWREARDQ